MHLMLFGPFVCFFFSVIFIYIFLSFFFFHVTTTAAGLKTCLTCFKPWFYVYIYILMVPRPTCNQPVTLSPWVWVFLGSWSANPHLHPYPHIPATHAGLQTCDNPYWLHHEWTLAFFKMNESFNKLHSSDATCPLDLLSPGVSVHTPSW